MVPASFHDFFSACATVAGALIGLLFVAISVAPAKLTGDHATAVHQVRAGAAFSALVNPLVLSLAALLPGSSIAGPVRLLAGIGLSTTVVLAYILFREHDTPLRPGQVYPLVILLVLYGLEMASGVTLPAGSHDAGHLGNLGGLIILFFAFAIGRSWEMVGARDTSLLHTVAQAAFHQLTPATPHEDEPGSPGHSSPGHSSPGHPGHPGGPAARPPE